MAAYGVRKPAAQDEALSISIDQSMPVIGKTKGSFNDSFSQLDQSPKRPANKNTLSSTSAHFRPAATQNLPMREGGKTQDEWTVLLGSQEGQAQRVDELVRHVKREVMKNEYGKPQYLQGLAQRENEREFERYIEKNQKRMFNEQNHHDFSEMILKENKDQQKRMEVSMYNSNEIRRKRQDGARDKAAVQANNKQLDDDEFHRVYQREQESKRLRFEWRKMCENNHDVEVAEQKRKASEEREENLKAGVHHKNLGTDYLNHMQYQQRASKKIDKRGEDLATSLTSNKRVGHKNEAQDAMTKSPNKITDTSHLNLETKKLKNLRAKHSPVSLKDLARLSEQQTEVGSARGNSTSLLQDEQSDYRDTTVQNTTLWNQVEESLKKEKRDNQMSYK